MAKTAKRDQGELKDPPEEARALIDPASITPEMLDAISLALKDRRQDAQNAREQSGIEATWKDAEEAYAGIDDANRTEWQTAKWTKPTSIDGPLTTGRSPLSDSAKSTVYIRMTARYVDAGAAKVAEILLPPDDKSFSFEEMPVPELIEAKKDQRHVLHSEMNGAPLTRPVAPQEMAQPAQGGGQVVPFPGQPQQPQHVPLRVADLAKENIAIAHEAAKKAEERVYNWMVECGYPAEMRKVIFDAARLGVGVLKGPFSKSYRGIKVGRNEDGGADIVIEEKVKPAVKWVSAWDIFPDPACVENIQDGEFIFERDYLTPRQVRELLKVKGYIVKQINRAIEAGPKSSGLAGSNENPSTRDKTKNEKRFEVWYYVGTLKRSELESLYVASGKDIEDENIDHARDLIGVIVTMIGDYVVRAVINPLDSGSLPYHAVPWQRRNGYWAGVGVAEQLRSPQRLLNGAVRRMADNAGLASGSQIVMDEDTVRPADGKWNVTPDKIWLKARGSAGASDTVANAFQIYKIPNTTQELMLIVELALKIGEESTSIPLVTQGQAGETTPDTLGATQLQNDNANQLLRSVGYAFDDHITEPVVRQLYEWLLLDPDVPDEEKAEFRINAHGSSALVERAIQDQTIAQMPNIVVNPAFGLDPKRWATMYIKSKRIDPRDLEYSDEEQERMAQQPPPQAPQVQVATINAQVKREQIASDEKKASADGTIALHDTAIKRDIAAGQIQGDLTKEGMRLEAAKAMNIVDHAVDLHKTTQAQQHDKQMQIEKPPAQTPGRAGNGRAFEQGP